MKSAVPHTALRVQVGTSGCPQPLDASRDLGDANPELTRHTQLVARGLPRTVTTRQGARAVGGTPHPSVVKSSGFWP